MNKKILFIIVGLIVLVVVIIGYLNMKKEYIEETPPLQKIEPDEEKDPIIKKIEEMTLEEKIGQMVIVGFDDYTLDDNTKKLIEEYYVGGFILFSKNIKDSYQLLKLTNNLKIINSNNNDIPLFMSVDEEGGRVSRMPDEIRKIPSNKVIGHIEDKDFSYNVGKLIAKEIKLMGFNMNFAPVLDIDSNPNNPVIGDRAFGSNEKIVSELGIETMKGIQSEGVISVVKHFPGHGDTSIDSHVGLPVIKKNIEEIMNFELVPFKEAINNKTDSIMIAHIIFENIDAENVATLSKEIINNLLRKELGFDGLVVTDDMTMGAITENYNIEDAAIKSVDAGSDIILVCHGYENQINVLKELRTAVKDGRISEERIDKSIYRILKLKGKYELKDETIENIDIDKINNDIRRLLNEKGSN
ncbi:beta-N-acetylhexosaminidase [Clostridium sp. D2Q-14]|uniref:beta-N-acetylhexosaminidase n=1 Tax=Anaeromonas gelatinilytica TaxID=2683194 RepID=UPI00193C0756|nr:beta-N-acetylhexosaminidase [Anaeromonas gelatinilytica]MBS4534095.1 beta-N-acetylhexosaminidase [Anaeromonas gelatinilytica]